MSYQGVITVRRILSPDSSKTKFYLQHFVSSLYCYTTFEWSLSTEVAYCKFLFNNVVKTCYVCVQKTCQLGHCQVTILINTEINTEEEVQESVLNLIN